MKNNLLTLATLLITLCGYAADKEKLYTSAYGYIENKGQIVDQNYQPNPHVKYLFNSSGVNVQLRANGFSYDTYVIEEKSGIAGAEEIETDPRAENLKTATYHFHRVDVEFVGANINPRLIAEKATADYTNYYTAGTPPEGVTGVKTFHQVTYKNLYDGIDLQFVVADYKPKFNFIVHPGADASLIRWRYIGASKAALENGNIVLSVATGDLKEAIPESFIEETSAKVNVAYVTNPDETFGFSVPAYKANSTLLIDPSPWVTYYGGPSSEEAYAVALDLSGNVVVAGATISTTAIATAGAHLSTFAGGAADCFIVSMTPWCSRNWATYYGGTGTDYFYGIICDSSGNLISVGYTTSTTGIATAGAYKTSYTTGASNHAIIVKMNSSGIRQWGTFFGGPAAEKAFSIALMAGGDFVFTGQSSYTATGIATPGAFQTTHAGGAECFLARFTGAGAAVWITYYGGTANDIPDIVRVDPAGNIVMAGKTASSTGIGTSGTHRSSLQNPTGGLTDGFVAKFSPSGSRIWGTYYGGADPDELEAMAIDTAGNIFISGITRSDTGIATPGAFIASTNLNGIFKGYVAKLNPSGIRQWGTYFGDRSSQTTPRAGTTDAAGAFFVVGTTQSDSGIATPNVHQPSSTGGNKAFLTKFTTSGSLDWGTYYGTTTHNKSLWDVTNEPFGITYTVGIISTVDSPITFPLCYQPVYAGGGSDVIIAAFTTHGYLPVELSSITVRSVDIRTAQLSWSTASEVTNDHFEIERSLNGQDWHQAGSVKGNGTTSHITAYQFTDDIGGVQPSPPVVYYRLKQVDEDGGFEYSEVVSLATSAKSPGEIRIFPNPNRGIFSLQLPVDWESVACIDVYDMLGNKVHTVSIHSSQHEVDLERLPKGLYTLKCQARGAVAKARVIIE